MSVPERKLIYGRFLVLPAIAAVFMAAMAQAVHLSTEYGRSSLGITAGLSAAVLAALLFMGLCVNYWFPPERRQDFRMLFRVCELLLFAVITVIGVELRMHLISSGNQLTDRFGIYEAADILRSGIRPPAGTPLFEVFCGDMEYYASAVFESLLISVFGYEEMASACGTFVLQLVGAVCAAGAARVFGGRFSGLAVYALFMCLPQEAALVLNLTGTPLYFAFLMAAVFLFAVIVDMEKEDNLVWVHILLYLMDGLLFGVALFIHTVTLVIVIALFLFLCFLRERREKKPLLSGCLRGFVLTAGAAASFFILLYLKAKDLKTSLETALFPYLQCYLPEGFEAFLKNYREMWGKDTYPVLAGGYTLSVENNITVVLILCLCCISLVFAFAEKRKGAIPASALFLGLSWLCGCGRVHVDAHLLFLAVLFLTGFLAQEFYLMFCPDGADETASEHPGTEEKETPFVPQVPDGTESEESEKAKEEEAAPKKEIHYLENPLPVPKKHVPKSLDFDIEVPDDDDFDIS